MEGLIHRLAEDVRGQPGALQFHFAAVSIACISDTNYDRMRLIAAIGRADELTAKQTRSILDANFHSALDARYATSDGIVYAAFIHPLSALTEQELESALHQVANLAKTFGTTYTSGLLEYGSQNSR